MVTHTARQAAVHQGVRRLDPLRDLAEVTRVIEEGFGNDLTRAGRRALREMRLWSRMGPLLWWMVAVSPEFREYHSGFVWVEDGHLVGTMNISRPRSHSRHWLVSNVAVRIAYRRQGIAHSLMQAALDWARDQGGEAVFLRVRRDNTAAWSLYQGLGFQPLYESMSLWLAQVPRVQKVNADDTVVVPYQSHHWRQVRELVRASIPTAFRWLEPLRDDEFHLTLNRQLTEWWANLTTGRQICRLVAWRGERIVAALVVRIAGHRGSHSLLLHVHPDYRGSVEEILIAEALSRLWPHGDRATLVTLPIAYDEIVNVLHRYGFVPRKTFTLMRRTLR